MSTQDTFKQGDVIEDSYGNPAVVLSTQGGRPYRIIDRKSTRLNSSHVKSSYAVFCLKKKNRALFYSSMRVSNYLFSESYLFVPADFPNLREWASVLIRKLFAVFLGFVLVLVFLFRIEAYWGIGSSDHLIMHLISCPTCSFYVSTSV